ncbi:hypothetical protein [uncultured Parabacteroides sp.]|uniref:hypothetical protein n=1 Tax=uncultured Parabacteroides sp. TaxID=512312 RepID=UPI002804C22C|nr:hypothetical protein [uncultured Parabacteroides sp.]
MIWHNIINWFGEMRDRYEIVNDFNRNAKMAFSIGAADVLLKASIAGGVFSTRAFRIKAMAGRSLTKQEQKYIGDVILANTPLVRLLITREFAYLEVHDNVGSTGLRWKLWNYAQMGGYLSNNNNM